MYDLKPNNYHSSHIFNILFYKHYSVYDDFIFDTSHKVNITWFCIC